MEEYEKRVNDLRLHITRLVNKKLGETHLCDNLVLILAATHTVFARDGEVTDRTVLKELGYDRTIPDDGYGDAKYAGLNPHTTEGLTRH